MHYKIIRVYVIQAPNQVEALRSINNPDTGWRYLVATYFKDGQRRNLFKEVLNQIFG